jgi:hypothetical protein
MEVGSSSKMATRAPSAPPGSKARPLSSTRPAVRGMCPGCRSLRSLPSSCINLLGCLSCSGTGAGGSDEGAGGSASGALLADDGSCCNGGAAGMGTDRPRLAIGTEASRAGIPAAPASTEAAVAGPGSDVAAAAVPAAAPGSAGAVGWGCASTRAPAGADKEAGMGASCSLPMASCFPGGDVLGSCSSGELVLDSGACS